MSGHAEAPAFGGLRIGWSYVSRVIRSAEASCARIVRLACSVTRGSRRTRSGSQAVVVLEPAELPLNGGPLPVERLPPLAAVRDQRVQPGSLDPLGRGLALAGRAPPLGGLPLGVGPGERPLAVLARRGLVLAGLDGGGLLERDHGPDAPRLAHVVHRLAVVALVQHGDLRGEPALHHRVEQPGHFALLGIIRSPHGPRERQFRLRADRPCAICTRKMRRPSGWK